MYVAFKEIRRSLGRFTLLTFAVALLVLLLLFFQAVAGTLTSGLTGGMESIDADVLVYDAQARRNPATSVLRPSVREQVAAIEGVAATAPIGLSVFTATAGREQIEVALVGGEPDGPSVPATIAEGRLPRAAGEALFSSSSFDEPIEIGRTVDVEGVTFRIVGAADDAAFNVLPTLYVRFADYRTAVVNRAGTSLSVPPSLIGVRVADGADPASVARTLTQSVEGIEALERSAAVDALPGVSTITQSFSILYLLLYVVVAIVTGVFFLILTVQKKEALVLLRAVGAARGDVIRSVLIQVLVVVGAGAVIGAAVTTALLAATRDVFGSTLGPATLATTVAAIVVLGVLASTGALRRVLRIDPVQATTPAGGL